MQTCHWAATTAIDDRALFRMNVTLEIERIGQHLDECGAREHWIVDCDEQTRAVLGELNLPLVHYLMQRLQCTDTELISMLKGAHILGKIDTSGRGVQKQVTELESTSDLWTNRVRNNRRLAESIRPTERDGEVMRQTLDEAKLGRISQPRVYKPGHDDELGVLSTRFGVQQNSDVRCIDNGTSSGCNPCSTASERIREHRLDTLFGMAQLLVFLGMINLACCKADVKAAFRRIPIHPDQRWATGIIFMFQGVLHTAWHYAMPFGFKGSVYAWERFANFLWLVAVSLLRIPVGKYVDDFFAVESAEIIEQTLECMARVFTAIMGRGSLSPKKLLCGNPLTILGFDVHLGHGFAMFQLNEEKRLSWLEKVMGFRESKSMLPCEAAVMAGRLSFASEFLFRRLGRAMLRPIFAQKANRCGTIGDTLDSALLWWEDVLRDECAEQYWFGAEEGLTAELFCDASGEPGHLCAVLFIGGQAFYCHQEVPDEWRSWVEVRDDAQIMAWELLAILMGLHTFAELLRGRTLRIWTDNEGCRGSITSGRARANDHNFIVHRIWKFCYDNVMNPWCSRVPTDDNCADGPTRSDHSIMRALGCFLVKAQVPPVV